MFSITIIFVSLLSTITSSLSKFQPRIVNGIPTLATNYSFIVDVRLYYPSWDIVDSSFCTASLIRLKYPATILTAAHCLSDITNQSLAVYLLRSDADAVKSNTNNFIFHPAWKHVVHENYNDTTLDNDIALIFLDEDVSTNPKLSKVELPTLDSTTGECCNKNDLLQVMGYGADYSDGPPTDTLEYTNVQFIPRNECIRRFQHYRTWEWYNCNYTTGSNWTCNGNYTFDGNYTGVYNFSAEVTENMICAIGNDTDSCQGDSGGPLIKTGSNVQVGVTSYGIGCNSGLPGVYVNLGLYDEWIQKQIGIANGSITTTTTTTENVVDETTLKPDGVNGYDLWMTVLVVMVSNLYGFM